VAAVSDQLAEPPRVWSGRPAPLGVRWDGAGVNAAVAAPAADAVEICLFDAAGRETRLPLADAGGGIWCGYLPGVGNGQRYGLRVHGPYAPEQGLRHNPAKLLVDPYARRLSGEFVNHPAVGGYADLDPYGAAPDPHDSAPYVPKSVVYADDFDWGDDHPPRVPWPDTIIYELHVKGFTRLHPDVPSRLRGTYAGLAHPAALTHLKRLGVTAVELLPVHAHLSEPHLLAKGLSNYWGYNTVGFFAPHAAYAATGDPVREFRAMVKALHAAGLEVLLDVVYNHTAEGGEAGPTLSLRGLGNGSYYRLDATDPGRYADVTGCGNTLDLRSPHALRLVLDSLRYWVEEMHVDGFRFDLAPALARTGGPADPVGTFDAAAPFLAAVHADPVLTQVKLIAEPWDVGHGGYQVGGFPAPWAEWNGRFRDTARDVWRGTATGVADLGFRLTGSSDLYDHSGRRPHATVNFVTSHDGFTLADLVSYEQKHNEANGEDNRDGDNTNHATNCGIEGPASEQAVLAERRRLRRAHVATLLLASGVPMLSAGDELGRTQRGNNNAYCQDNPTSWLDWGIGDAATSADPAGHDPMLLTLVRGLIALRRRSPVLRRHAFFRGGPSHEAELADITWFRADGARMDDDDWHSPRVATLAAYLSGQHLPWAGTRGEPLHDHSYLIVLHPGQRDAAVRLPGRPWAASYVLLLDTSAEDLGGFPGRQGIAAVAGADIAAPARSVLLLRAERWTRG
jgi:glycogen operon protein